MHRARRCDTWWHTANVMALVANCHRDPKRMRRPYDVSDFLPPDLRTAVRGTSGIRLTTDNLRALKPLFCKQA